MKIELEIDASNLKETVEDTLKSLSQEKKEQLCEKIMLAWLGEPHDNEREREHLRLQTAYGSQDYRYRDALGKFESSRDKMLAAISKEAAAMYCQKVRELVDNDTQLQAKYTELKEVLINKFPEMVQHAMVAWFASGFQGISNQLNELWGNANTIQNLLSESRLKLGLTP